MFSNGFVFTKPSTSTRLIIATVVTPIVVTTTTTTTTTMTEETILSSLSTYLTVPIIVF